MRILFLLMFMLATCGNLAPSYAEWDRTMVRETATGNFRLFLETPAAAVVPQPPTDEFKTTIVYDCNTKKYFISSDWDSGPSMKLNPFDMVAIRKFPNVERTSQDVYFASGAKINFLYGDMENIYIPVGPAEQEKFDLLVSYSEFLEIEFPILNMGKVTMTFDTSNAKVVTRSASKRKCAPDIDI